MQQNQPLGITKVALDAMGGDNAPAETVKGAVDAVDGETVTSRYLLIGQQDDGSKQELAKYTLPGGADRGCACRGGN